MSEIVKVIIVLSYEDFFDSVDVRKLKLFRMYMPIFQLLLLDRRSQKQQLPALPFLFLPTFKNSPTAVLLLSHKNVKKYHI